jgi:hypothetical protein
VGVLEAALREAKLEGARSLEMVRRLALYGVGEDTTPVEALATIAHYVTGKIGIRDVALGGGQEQTGADG